MDRAPQATLDWNNRMQPLLGSTLQRFRFLDEGQARQATARRERLFRRARQLGLKCREDNCEHLYTGELSPGCESCTEGTWSCLFINGRCNRRCFYCPQVLGETKTRPPLEASFEQVFERPEDYVGFLRRFGFRGMSISGGEPFLTFDNMVRFIRRTREEFGREMYIWAYTNGSLYTPEKGAQLVEAGLDELRFDIGANHYDLDAVAAAVKTIPRVAVEIPAVPEDKDVVLGLLPRLAELGVGFLNLHQLYTTNANCEAFAGRGYTLVRGRTPAPAVLESEICALEIICHALEKGIRLPINYCSTAYKVRFQGRGKRRRHAEALMRSGLDPTMGSPTAAAVFRQLVIRGDEFENQALAERFRLEGVDPGRFALADDDTALYLHPDLLAHPAIGPRHVFVYYFSYEVDSGTCRCTCEGQPVEDAHNGSGVRRTGPMGQLELHNDVARLGFQKLFIEGWPIDRTLALLAAGMPASFPLRQRIDEFLHQVHAYGKDLEYLDAGFAPYG